MGEYDCYLVTLVRDYEIARCAVKTKTDYLYVSKEDVWSELPEHVQSYGKVVRVERIFEVLIESE